MPISYTNRKNRTYYLCQGTTKKGRIRYYFAREPSEKCLEEVPAGYEIVESVNGVVSIRKLRPQVISDLEVQTVKAVLRDHSDLRGYRVDVREKAIVIYESSAGGIDDVAERIFGLRIPDSMRDEIRETETLHAHYSPVMRFVLVDEEDRLFSAERMCHRGSIDGWLSLHNEGRIHDLAETYICHLGKDSFYDLPFL